MKRFAKLDRIEQFKVTVISAALGAAYYCTFMLTAIGILRLNEGIFLLPVLAIGFSIGATGLAVKYFYRPMFKKKKVD